MKKKEIQELKNKPLVELEKLAREYREKLRTLQFDFAAKKLQNVMTLKEAKKDLARVLTFISVQTSK